MSLDDRVRDHRCRQFTERWKQIDHIDEIITAIRSSQTPAEAKESIVEVIADSAGQALPTLAERPGSEPVVEAISEAFADAATTTGLVAVVFVLAGFVLSLRLPDIRYTDRPGDQK